MSQVESVLQAARSSAPPRIPTVMVVNADAAAREYLESVIRNRGWQVTSFADAGSFLAHPQELVPRCLILDVELPGIGGLELQEFLLDRRDLPVMFVSDCSDVRTTVRAMKAGALEFFTRPFIESEIVGAIREALARSGAALGQEAGMRILRERYALLSPREREVMALVVAGKPNKLIADALGISEITVKTHRGRVMRKMKAASMPDLVRIAGAVGPPHLLGYSVKT